MEPARQQYSLDSSCQQNSQVLSAQADSTTWRWPSHAINHCTIYSAPCRVLVNVVGCIGSKSIVSICCMTCCTVCCRANPQQIEPMDFEPYMPYTSAGQPIATRGAVNTRLPAVAVYIAPTYRRFAMAKFTKSRVCDKVPEGSTLIFGNTLLYIKHSIA